MKIRSIVPILVILTFGCEKYQLEKISELPDNIYILKLCDNLADSILVLFPERKNFSNNNTDYFFDDTQKKIVLGNESEVYVSFIDEGASLKNSLYWYSYNNSSPPFKASDINGEVLFPNISKTGEGGKLETGYTLKLGTEKFPTGTVIGFFLVANGWKDGDINLSNPIYYTDYSFNPGANQQHVLFKHSNCGEIIIGFEDISTDDVNCDKDFNDILFSVSDNHEGYEATSFNLTNVVLN